MGKRKANGRTQIYKGRFAFYPTFSSGTHTLSANGVITLNPRLTSLCDVYQLYRFRRLKFGFSEGSWGSQTTGGKWSTGYAAGLYLEIPDTLPTTDHTKLLEAPHSMFMSGSWAATSASTPTGYQGPLQAGYPHQYISVGAKHLLGDAPYKWWRTRAGTTTDVWQLCQWTLFLVAEDTTLGSALQATYWCDYEIELSDPVDPSQTPAPLLKGVDDIKKMSKEDRDSLIARLAIAEVTDNE